MILAPVVPVETSKWIMQFPSSLPYVFFDATLPNVSPVTEIGQEPFSGGYLAGKLLHLFALKEAGTYCVITPHSEDFHINQRIKGFLSYWHTQDADSKIDVRTCIDMDHKETRDSFLRTLLQEIPEPRGIFVANASVHSVAEWVNKRGKKHIPIIGYDLVPENERLLREGLIDVLISQRPAYQGYQAVYQLYRHGVLQQQIERNIPVPIHIYFKENLLSDVSPDMELSVEAMEVY
ncbi:MAG: substrate-binding domain-containing protein [Spirochaetales bacterium]